MKLKRLNLDGDGLTLFVGPLEARVLDAMFEGARTIPNIHRALMVDTPFIAYTTVATTVGNLVDKGFAVRIEDQKPGIAEYQTNAANRDHFVELAVEMSVRALVQNYGASVGRAIRKLTKAGA